MQTAHLRQWKHNREFIGLIDPRYPDWVVTAIFYTALHAVDTLLKKDKVQGTASHDARNRALMLTKRYAQIWKHYRPLHNLSKTVRYQAQPESWIAWDRLDVQVIRIYLHPIEESVQKLIGQDLQLAPIVLRPPP